MNFKEEDYEIKNISAATAFKMYHTPPYCGYMVQLKPKAYLRNVRINGKSQYQILTFKEGTQ